MAAGVLTILYHHPHHHRARTAHQEQSLIIKAAQQSTALSLCDKLVFCRGANTVPVAFNLTAADGILSLRQFDFESPTNSISRCCSAPLLARAQHVILKPTALTPPPACDGRPWQGYISKGVQPHSIFSHSPKPFAFIDNDADIMLTLTSKPSTLVQPTAQDVQRHLLILPGPLLVDQNNAVSPRGRLRRLGRRPNR